jgi:hypothetical protein
MEQLLNALAIFSIALFVIVLFSVRRAHIRVEYSVSWLTAAVTLFVLSRSSSLLEWLAARVGITYPPLALLLIASGVFLVVFYRFSVRISDLKDANIALAQRLAILEYQLHATHESKQTPSQS